jgi:DNA replication protein DnaC
MERTSGFRRLALDLDARVAAAPTDPATLARMREAHEARCRARRDAHEAAEWARLEAHLVECGALEEDAELVAKAASGEAPLRFEAALREACAFWASGKTFLALLGECDTGKTLAAVALMSLYRQAVPAVTDLGDTWVWDRRVVYALATEVAALGNFGEASLEGRARLERAPLLVIDELCTESETGPWLTNLNHLINTRKGAGLRTVLIANQSWEVFAARYGERIARRVKQAGHRYVFGKHERLNSGSKP